MKNNKVFSKYLTETLSTNLRNQLPISSVCNAKCVFCSNKMNPFEIYREGFRPLEDIKKGLCLIDPKVDEIRISDSLPGRISEGEALLHPDLFKILKLIRDYSSATIQITTNATLLTKELIEKLVPFKPIRFSVSYHSDNEANWRRIFGLGKEKYKAARDSFFLLRKRGFDVDALMVPMPRLTGYDDIEKTIQKLMFFVRSIYIWLPGYTRMAKPAVARIMNADYAELGEFFRKMRKKYRVDINFMADPSAPLDFFPHKVMIESHNRKIRKAAWFFSEAAFDRGNALLNRYNRLVPNEHRGFMAKNRTYGGNIVCSGLLMVRDFRAAMKEQLAKKKNSQVFDLCVLPMNAFNRFGDDLTLENYSTLSKEFNVEVWPR